MSERRSELKAVSSDSVPSTQTLSRDVLQMTTRAIEGWMLVSGRLANFTQKSLRDGLSVAEELRRAQSPADAMELQSKFMRQLYDESMDEAKKMGELVMKISNEAVGEMVRSR